MKLTIFHELILKELAKSEDPLTISNMARETTMHPYTVEKKLLELEKEGVVKRQEKKWELVKE